MKSSNTRKITRSALLIAFSAICSQIAFPLFGGVPITLQTFAMALAGAMLPFGEAVVFITSYILLGICGIPVFSGFGAGLQKICGVTGGFIIGFYFIVCLTSLGRKKGFWYSVLLSSLGIALCHLTGVLQYAVITGTDFIKTFLLISAPYLLKDFVSCILAIRIAERLTKSVLKI